MTRGFLAVSAALLVAAITLSPAMAYTICSSAVPPYTIGSGSPYQYTVGSSGLQPYTIGSGSPYQYTVGSDGLKPYTIGSGSPYQYTVGSSGLQPYTIGMGTPAASTGTCEVTAPVTTKEAEEEVVTEEAFLEEVTGELVSEDNVTEEVAPEDNVTEEAAPEDNVTEEVAPEDNVTEEVAPEEPVLMNIIETAAAAGNLNVLVAAVEAANLTETLSGDGPFTVFAPTDDAFAAAEIDMADIEALIATLNYHVALGKYMASDLAGMPTVATLGGDVTITVTEEGLMVNGAKIVQEDVVCSNGVIQVIDAVITPAEETPAEETPAEEPPIEETPVDETPAEEPPA